MSKPPATHTAFVLKRETRNRLRWLEVGEAELQLDGRSGSHNIYLDRLPVGGFTGHIVLHPCGTRPADPVPEPARPGESESESR
jgi:hypothetical protein